MIMTPTLALAIAVTFVWLGMVLAISFVEAPLRFRAPEVTLPIGLGIGRLVFRALNTVETLFAVVLATTVAASAAGSVLAAVAVTDATLVVQLLVVRPRLTRRSDLVLAGRAAPRSRAHHAYVALEIMKVMALIVTGALLLRAG